jgi:hypothetical protein
LSSYPLRAKVVQTIKKFYEFPSPPSSQLHASCHL